TDLASTIFYFRQQPVDAAGANSFTRTSFAAQGGWGTADLLNPLTSPLAVELALIKPAIALIQIGTRDVGIPSDLGSFRSRLTAIVDATIANGTIPVLSTIPDILVGGGPYGPVASFNQVIADVAANLDVPLWNYWAAMQSLP